MASRQAERTAGSGLYGRAISPAGVALVVARVIEHYHERLVSRQRVGQLVEEGHGGRPWWKAMVEGNEGVFILVCVDLLDTCPLA